MALVSCIRRKWTFDDRSCISITTDSETPDTRHSEGLVEPVIPFKNNFHIIQRYIRVVKNITETVTGSIRRVISQQTRKGIISILTADNNTVSAAQFSSWSPLWHDTKNTNNSKTSLHRTRLDVSDTKAKSGAHPNTYIVNSVSQCCLYLCNNVWITSLRMHL